MDMQKELEAFEAVYQPSKEIAFCWGVQKYVQLSVEENHTDIVDHANDSLRIWQAAKAQTMPKGFILMPRICTNKMAHAAKAIDGRLSAFKYADVYKAMIEAAQEKEVV